MKFIRRSLFLFALCSLFIAIDSLQVLAEVDMRISAYALSPDGSKFAIGYVDGRIEITDSETGLFSEFYTDYQQVISLDWNPVDDSTLAIGFLYSRVKIVRLNPYQEITEINPDNFIRKAMWNAGGTKLAILGETGGGASSESSVQIWDQSGHTRLITYQDGGYSITEIAWHPSNSSLLLIGAVKNRAPAKIKLWDVDQNEIKWERTAADYGSMTLIWSPDAARFAIVTRDTSFENAGQQIIDITDSHTGHSLHNFRVEASLVRFIVWGMDNRLILTGIQDIETWDITQEILVNRIPTPDAFFELIASPFGGRIFFIDTLQLSNTERDFPFDGGLGLHFFVPQPSLDQLTAVAENCVAKTTLTKNISPPGILKSSFVAALKTHDLPDFVAQVKALPADTIPAACQADLIAVAEALIAQQ